MRGGEEAFFVNPAAGGEWRLECEALEELPECEDVVVGFGGDGGFYAAGLDGYGVAGVE